MSEEEETEYHFQCGLRDVERKLIEELDEEKCISFSKEKVIASREKRLQSYKKIIQDDLDREIQSAKDLLAENGYIIIEPTK